MFTGTGHLVMHVLFSPIYRNSDFLNKARICINKFRNIVYSF